MMPWARAPPPVLVTRMPQSPPPTEVERFCVLMSNQLKAKYWPAGAPSPSPPLIDMPRAALVRQAVMKTLSAADRKQLPTVPLLSEAYWSALVGRTTDQSP